MSTLTPDDARTILHNSALPSLQMEHSITKGVIAAIPADKSEFRPDSIVKSALDLAWHIVSAETRFLEAVINGAFDFTNTAKPESLRAPGDVNAWYSERFASDLDQLKRLTGEHLLRIVDFRGIFKMPAFAYAEIGLHHTIHHRGQLSMYLRPMGAKVPSIYGESYDARLDRETRELTKSEV